MAILATDILDAARDRHPSFDPKSQPDTVLYRFLNQYAKQLAQKIAQRRPAALTWQTLVTALPVADHYAGIVVPEHLLLPEATALRAGGTSPQDDVPIPVIRTQQRTRWGQPWPSLFLLNDTAYLAATAEDWRPYASVSIRYIPNPVITGAGSTIVLPTTATAPLVDNLAAFMAKRRQGMSDAPPAGLWSQEAVQTEEVFLQGLQRMNATEDVVIQDVFGDNGGW